MDAATVADEAPATFEALPQSIVRDEVLKHCGGSALCATACASKALRDASQDASRAQLKKRFGWLWPSAARPKGPRPRGAAPAGGPEKAPARPRPCESNPADRPGRARP